MTSTNSNQVVAETAQTSVHSLEAQEYAGEYRLCMHFMDPPLENPSSFHCPQYAHSHVGLTTSTKKGQSTAHFDATSGEKSDKAAQIVPPQSDKFAYGFTIRNEFGVRVREGCGAALKPTRKKDGFIELFGGAKLLEAVNPEETPDLLVCGDSEEAIHILEDLWLYHLDNRRVSCGLIPEAHIIAKLQLRGRKRKSYQHPHMARLAVRILCIFTEKYQDSRFNLKFRSVYRETNFSCDRSAQVGHQLSIGQKSSDIEDTTYDKFEQRYQDGTGFCRFDEEWCLKCGNVKHEMVLCPYYVPPAPPAQPPLGRVPGKYRCFVGGLASDIGGCGLWTVFREYASLTNAEVMVNNCTGQSRKFGFVTFSNKGDMNAAILAKNGITLRGRTIKVMKEKIKKFSAVCTAHGGSRQGGGSSFSQGGGGGSQHGGSRQGGPVQGNQGRGRSRGQQQQTQSYGSGPLVVPTFSQVVMSGGHAGPSFSRVVQSSSGPAGRGRGRI